ncbi:hypothetical protein [Chitinophaga sp. XS-30]|uniref:DUF6934 family protein n=1 Tax=Chitinophaga sp. XS-30 TaxID=2604421 RepID=UPI0011DD3391|nr:hypothetical protein [Chitinophaga sp. XS-30]QEH42616.1 hypothetical protein FW415_17740 [Chitinophaga sp. XS-30]
MNTLNVSPYKIQAKGLTKYEFESIGAKGAIKKGVEIFPLEVPGIYNFAFGDLLPDGTIDDEAETNNGDMPRVFSTVIEVMEKFLHAHPNASLFFSGSSPQRTNVYQLILKRYHERFSFSFQIIAFQTVNNEPLESIFDPEAEGNFLGFLVKRK